MEELLQEYCDSRGLRMRVDREGGVIRGVKILGLLSGNRRRYLPAALAQAVSLYEGAKVNVNHPKGSPLAPRDYQDRIGAIRDVSVRPGEGLFGDLHFNPKHALAEQLAWDADHAPENVGFSHNVQARTSQQPDGLVVEAILKVHGVDLVADPATTRGLFESRPGESSIADQASAAVDRSLPESLTVEQIKRLRPDLVDALLIEHAAEVRQLRLEIDRLKTWQALHQRRRTARALLAEYGLPDPDLGDPKTQAIVSDVFIESLMAAPSDAEMRKLVVERARLVEEARLCEFSAARGRPRSQDQSLVDTILGEAIDAKGFAEAIT